MRRGNPFLATEGNFRRHGVAPLHVDGAVEKNCVLGRNDVEFAISFAKVDLPNVFGYEFEINFAAEISPVDAANDGREDTRVFGD